MKKLITAVLATAMLFGLTACGNSDTLVDNGEQTRPERTSQQTEQTEPATIAETAAQTEPVTVQKSYTANELHEIIMNNLSTWQSYEMTGVTLADLDFDGVPEFLVTHKKESGWEWILSIFKINDDGKTMKKIKTVENLYYSDNVHTEQRAIIPYIDEKGSRSWIIPYKVEGHYYDSQTYKSVRLRDYSEYFMSAFDFAKDGAIHEMPIFSNKIYYNYNPDDYNNPPYGYEGYSYAKAEYYFEGARVYADDNENAVFWQELEDLLEQARKDAAADEFDMDIGWYLPWGCGGYYPSPDLQAWEDMKTEFLNRVLEQQPAYNLYANILPYISDYDGALYMDTYSEEGALTYYDSESNKQFPSKNLSEIILKIAQDYYGSRKYIETYDLFYNNEGAMCKPVLYLYPEKTTDVSVKIKFPAGGYFTATYPEYDRAKGWNVTASPDSTLINKADNLEYSYLYWAARGFTPWKFNEGFCVKGEDTAKFLQEKLSYMGLTPREYNELIVYFLPKMQNNPYNIITFQTDDYANAAPLYISPEPDSVLRVFMSYKSSEKAVEIPEQTLETFERNGFTVVEWGGSGCN